MPEATKKATQVTAIAAACTLAATCLTMGAEGLRTKAYRDPARPDLWTRCYGHTGGVKPGDVRTPDQCLAELQADLGKHGTAIDACIKVQIPVEARAAFTDFAFNVGAANFCGSTMARKLNGGDLRGACAEFPRWIYAGGKVLPGIVKRRAAEQALCEKGLANG